jgi:endonuclease-3
VRRNKDEGSESAKGKRAAPPRAAAKPKSATPSRAATKTKSATVKRASGRFGRESLARRRERAAEVISRLRAEYPDAKCSLDHRNPYELLVATILSAQCTDERVNMVTPALFRRYPTPAELAEARPEELEELIRSTGFFRNKTKSLLGMANAVVDAHRGSIPEDMTSLTALPGVGRKTANVVIGNAFQRNEGVVVDTHVTRLAQRLGFTRESDPVKIEQDLVRIVPQPDWTDVSHLLIYHGRAVCKAAKPRHEVCVVCDICPTCVL